MGDNGASILIFGAGNIGRSFIGQVFARGGWRVTFVDVDRALVDALNEFGSYRVVIRREGAPDDELMVENVRAIDGRDGAAVSRAVAQADCLVSSVGKAALPRIIPALAAGLLERVRAAVSEGGSPRPLDIILAENDRDAADTLRRGLGELLPADFPLGARLGIVETSIGKMVPLMRAEDLKADRLQVFAEAYDTLILDRKGFLGVLPEVEGLKPVDSIRAYVDRKLFVHNLGHAAVAYLGYESDPSIRFVEKALGLPGVREGARRAMTEAAAALAAEYPDTLDTQGLAEHIDDLLSRFANEALGDTLHRVGRDLFRKLGRSDRIVGAALLCERQALPWSGIARVFSAALTFRAPGENGDIFPADEDFARLLADRGTGGILGAVCGLEASDPIDAALIRGFSG
jgi:mannitol-1-phosphate 5-dehydrogenase